MLAQANVLIADIHHEAASIGATCYIEGIPIFSGTVCSGFWLY